MISTERSEEFEPRFEVVSCYVEHAGEIVLLLRPEHKSEGGKWGVPAGKIEPGESAFKAMVREMREETGIPASEDELEYLSVVFVRFPDYDFVYHMFRHVPTNRPIIRLNPGEHQRYVWVTPERALKMNLVRDLDACISVSYGI